MITQIGLNIYIDGVKHNKTPRWFNRDNYSIEDVKTPGSSFQVQFSKVYSDGTESALSSPQTHSLVAGVETYNYNQDVVLVFNGNSLTKGTIGGGTEQYYPNVVKDFFTTKFNTLEFYSYAGNGDKMWELWRDAPTNIHPRVVTAKNNFIIMWEDINSFVSLNYSADDQWQAVKEYFDGCRAAGYNNLILITGYHPRQHPYNPEGIRQRDIFIQRVLDTPIAEASWDYHIDLNEASNIGGAKGLLQNEYFHDMVHLKPIGYDIVANTVINKILDIIKI